MIINKDVLESTVNAGFKPDYTLELLRKNL